MRPRVLTAMPCCRAQARTSDVGTAEVARRPVALVAVFFAAFVARLAGREDAAVRVDLVAARAVVRFAVRPDELVDLLDAAAVFFAALAVPRPRPAAGRPRRPALVARRRRERAVSKGPTAFWNCSRCRAHRSNSRTVPAMSRRMCPAATSTSGSRSQTTTIRSATATSMREGNARGVTRICVALAHLDEEHLRQHSGQHTTHCAHESMKHKSTSS